MVVSYHVVLGIEPRALCMTGKYPSTELLSRPFLMHTEALLKLAAGTPQQSQKQTSILLCFTSTPTPKKGTQKSQYVP